MTGPSRPLRVESLCDTGGDGVTARLTGLSAEVRELHRDVLRGFLVTGQAPHRCDLAAVGGIDREEALRQLREVDLVHMGADGRVAVAYPFSGQPTGHRVQLDGGPVLHAMCAIDALGIALMTGRDAVIESADPDDRQPIRVERRAETWRWVSSDAAVLLAQTRGCGPAADCLCPAITFHTSRRRAEAHLRGCPDLTGKGSDLNPISAALRGDDRHSRYLIFRSGAGFGWSP